MRPKRLVLILGGVVVLVVALLIVGSRLMSPSALSVPMTPDATAVPLEVAVRSRGKVVPETWADLAFTVNGTVSEWLVTEGDRVEAGTTLARLDSTELNLAVQEAQLGLEIAEQRLVEAEAERGEQIAEAEVALQIAEQRLAQGRNRVPGLTEAQIRLASAMGAEARAQDEYSKSLDRQWEDPAVRDDYRTAFEQATDQREIAAAALSGAEADQAAAGQELTILASEVARARLALARAQAPVAVTLTQEAAQAAVRLEQAKAKLAATTLVAPFSGTVLEMQVEPGDLAQPGMTVVTLADLTGLRIETTDLDEWGAAQIAVGSPVEITVTAFDDKVLHGRVAEIALRGAELPAGDIAYRTIIVLDEADPELRWGMTVRIVIPLGEL